MNLIIRLVLNGLLVFGAAYLTPGVAVNGFVDAIVVGALLGLANFFLKPILTFLTLPLTVITLGLFLLVINGAMVLLVDAFWSGFAVDGLLWAILFSLILSVFNGLFGMGSKKEERR